MPKLLAFLLVSICCFSQNVMERKNFSISKAQTKIKIDADFSEEAWKDVPLAKDFFEFRPNNLASEKNELRTEVKMLYDDSGIYFAAKMYDNEPDKILKEIADRDKFGVSDVFAVFINGYNDGQQQYSFFVTAGDSQSDCIRTAGQGEDFSWDAIWYSKAKMVDDGWQVEIFIPYAALRFPKQEKQTWGIQLFREIRRNRQVMLWNKVNNALGTFEQQDGVLAGIENIQPPTRLFFIPYTSFYLGSVGKNKAKGDLRGGLDLKYGINDAFTLDAILIPDFGQTKFDNVELNLGPFEQVFSENRPFFTEGTDLFNKAEIFYSRRIGGEPINSPNVDSGETLIESPANVSLINALKVSGRTNSGLGIGVLNAVTDNAFAKIQSVDGATRQELLDPFSNYNMLVFDQRFNSNSSIAFSNGSVVRNGDFRDSNVSALTYALTNSKNTHVINGNSRGSYVSLVPETKEKFGQTHELSIDKISGKWRYGLGTEYRSKFYDDLDLGQTFKTNYYAFGGDISYRILTSTEKLNSFNMNLNQGFEFNNQTHQLQDHDINFSVNANNKNNHAFGAGMGGSLFKAKDFYDPRSDQRFIVRPLDFYTYFYISTNYNNTFAFDINPSIATTDETGRWAWDLSIGPRYRFSNRLNVILNFTVAKSYLDQGWVDFQGDDIIYAVRNRENYEASLQAKYSVNAKMNLNLNLRNYWSYAENLAYKKLTPDGLLDNTSYDKNKNVQFNTWNLDLSYSWWVLPGSQLQVLYRNQASLFSRIVQKQYFNHFKELLTPETQGHTFSISFRYFLDYNDVAKVFKSKV